MPTFIKYSIEITILVVLSVSCQTTSRTIESPALPIQLHQITTKTGKQIEAIVVAKGSINLYYKMIPIEEANLYNPYFPYNSPAQVTQYYIGKTKMWRIDEWNYEYILKEVFVDAPYLKKKLGHQGFRFENLSQMVKYYNEQFALKMALEAKKE